MSKMTNEGKVTIFSRHGEINQLRNRRNITYCIVGEDEADIKQGKISVNSPIARALVNKMQGDEVEVKTPKGPIEFLIEEVLYI